MRPWIANSCYDASYDIYAGSNTASGKVCLPRALELCNEEHIQVLSQFHDNFISYSKGFRYSI